MKTKHQIRISEGLKLAWARRKRTPRKTMFDGLVHVADEIAGLLAYDHTHQILTGIDRTKLMNASATVEAIVKSGVEAIQNAVR